MKAQFALILSLGTFASGARADLTAVDAMNGKIASSSNDYLDYALADVCVDSSDAIVAGDPAVCAQHRNLRIGEKIPYILTDVDKMYGNRTYQGMFNYPIPGTDGALKVIIPKFSDGNFLPSWTLKPFKVESDGYDLYDLGSGYVSDIRTSDGGCFDQKIESGNGRLNGWIMFGSDLKSSSSVHGISITRISPNVPASCGAPMSSGKSNAANDVWNAPVSISYETGKSLQSVVSYHFADKDLTRQNNALERFYFTREYGFTRWESWMPLSRCQKDFASEPERCQVASSKNMLAGRCGASAPIAGTATWGNQAWVRFDCRDLTNYIALDKPLIPLYDPASGAIPRGEEDGLRDVDTATVFAVAARGVIISKAPATAEHTESVARSVPGGTYTLTCSECSAAANVLSCSCKSRGSSVQKTQLGYASCQGDISNQNGQLACSGASPASQNGPTATDTGCTGNACASSNAPVALPGGPYSLTCAACSADGSQMTCSCKTRRKRWETTSIAYPQCRSGITNFNGKLICDGIE